MIVTAIIKDNNEEWEIRFSIKKGSTNKEILDKAFEIGMNKYGNFESVEIINTEED